MLYIYIYIYIYILILLLLLGDWCIHDWINIDAFLYGKQHCDIVGLPLMAIFMSSVGHNFVFNSKSLNIVDRVDNSSVILYSKYTNMHPSRYTKLNNKLKLYIYSPTHFLLSLWVVSPFFPFVIILRVKCKKGEMKIQHILKRKKYSFLLEM